MLTYKINNKEKCYAISMYAITIMSYCFLYYSQFIYLSDGTSVFDCIAPALFVILVYGSGILIGRYILHIIFKGHIVGNAAKVTSDQFPQIYNIIEEQSRSLGFDRIPTAYIMNGNGLLNALTFKFLRKHYVLLFSETVTATHNNGLDVLKFIIGHELGHIKRKHLSSLKSFFKFPAMMIPFLYHAYKRASEYTCDNIGYALAPKGAARGLAILSVGGTLAGQLKLRPLINGYQDNKGFASFFSEICSTHPHLVKRIMNVGGAELPSLWENTIDPTPVRVGKDASRSVKAEMEPS